MPRYKKILKFTKRKTSKCNKRHNEEVQDVQSLKKRCTISAPKFLKFRSKSKRHMTFSPSRTPKRKFFTKNVRWTIQKLSGIDKNELVETKRMLKFETEGYSYKKSEQKEIATSDTLPSSNNHLFIGDDESNEYEELNDEINETTSLLADLVRNGKYSTSNISFKLFKDTLKWHDCKTTSEMRYSEDTKEFFWTSQRLLGGQFIRFMRGFAHQGLVKEGKATLGYYDPSSSDINIPVPSDRVLNDFRPKSIAFGCDKLEPGILKEKIEIYGKAMEDTSFTIMFDGKKITPNSADINLLNHEEEPKMEDIRKAHQLKITRLEMYHTYITEIMEKGQTKHAIAYGYFAPLDVYT